MFLQACIVGNSQPNARNVEVMPRALLAMWPDNREFSLHSIAFTENISTVFENSPHSLMLTNTSVYSFFCRESVPESLLSLIEGAPGKLPIPTSFLLSTTWIVMVMLLLHFRQNPRMK